MGGRDLRHWTDADFLDCRNDPRSFLRLVATTILKPHFMDPDGWRQVVKNNARIEHVVFTIHTSETWLPTILRDAGFFPSNSEVKKNRKDLWRDVEHGETVKLSWARVLICLDRRTCL